MRYRAAALGFALLAAPVCARANDGVAGPLGQAAPQTCASPAVNVGMQAKPALLADRQAGQLIENAGTLKAAAPSTSRDQGPAVEGTIPCTASALPSPSPNFSRIVMMSGLPLAASRLTSGFGTRVHPLLGDLRMHSGIDLAAPEGTPIFATYAGTVTQAGWAGGYGLSATIMEQGGLEMRFGHMSRLNVARGQAVRRGDVVGYGGSTGLSTGPHLHYELRFRGQALDPAPWLAFRRSLKVR
jgi:murein DD-endopeptidase MepM/ murein hydrolase activator NlpD